MFASDCEPAAGENAKAQCRGCNKLFVRLGVHLGRELHCRSKYWLPTDSKPEANLARAAEKFDNELYAAGLLDIVFKDLAEWYWFRYLGETVVNVIRSAVKRWVDYALTDLGDELERIIGNKSIAAEVLARLHQRFNFFKGLETEAQVQGHANRTLPTLSCYENVVGPGPGDRSYHVMISEWLELLMRRDLVAREHILKASERWTSGAKMDSQDVLRDMDDGEAFRAHWFSKPVVRKPGDRRVLRVGLLLGYDDLELLNPIGVKRGEKKVGGFYGAIVNLPPKERFNHKYMQVLSIVEEKVLTRCDPVRVVAGADPKTGELCSEDFASLGAQFRSTEGEDITITVPTSDTPGSPWEEFRLELACLGVAADFLAKTKLKPDMMGTRAYKFCGDCDFDRCSPPAQTPVHTHTHTRTHTQQQHQHQHQHQHHTTTTTSTSSLSPALAPFNLCTPHLTAPHLGAQALAQLEESFFFPSRLWLGQSVSPPHPGVAREGDRACLGATQQPAPEVHVEKGFKV